MTRTLILMRHAETHLPAADERDFDRMLTQQGVHNAAKAGHWLREQGVQPQAVFYSAAQRATQTAHLLNEQLESETLLRPVEELYEASPREMLSVINNLNDDWQTVLILAHNPTLGYMAEYLVERETLSFPTAGMLAVSFELDSWTMVGKHAGSVAWNRLDLPED